MSSLTIWTLNYLTNPLPALTRCIPISPIISPFVHSSSIPVPPISIYSPSLSSPVPFHPRPLHLIPLFIQHSFVTFLFLTFVTFSSHLPIPPSLHVYPPITCQPLTFLPPPPTSLFKLTPLLQIVQRWILT